MLRGGAPDFIAIKIDAEGNVIEFKGVEVKSKNGSLTYEQAVYKKLFKLAGIPYVVEVSEPLPHQSIPSQTIGGKAHGKDI